MSEAGRSDRPFGRIHLIPPQDLPDGFEVVLDEQHSSRTVLQRLLAPRMSDSCALLVKVATLNSPDQISFVSALVQKRRLDVDVELLAFDAPLFANVLSAAVLELEPLPMGPGPAELRINVHRSSFHTLDRPDLSIGVGTTTRTLMFTVPA